MRVAVVGSYGVGMTMRLPRLPVAGETLLGGEYSSGHGGKGSNQAVGAARLGAAVALLTAVGDDPLGDRARQLWEQEGVDASAVVTVPDAATMVGMILVEPSGENRIILAAGALDHLTPAHVAGFAHQLADADIAVVSLEIPLETALEALRIAHRAGTRTLLNPAPAQPIPADAWPAIDVVTPNRTEAAILLGHAPPTDSTGPTPGPTSGPTPGPTSGPAPESLAAELHSRGAGTVVLTLGGDGVITHDDDGTRHVPAAPARTVVDTTGAGDAFTAALAVALAEGAGIGDAIDFAARAGAHTVSIAEVIPALARREDLADQLPPAAAHPADHSEGR